MEYISITIASIISLYLTLIVSKSFNLYDLPSKEKIHLKKIPNSAGLATILIILISISIFKYENLFQINFYLMILIVIIGFLDDIINFRILSKFILILIPTLLFTYNISEIDSLGIYKNFEFKLGHFSGFFTVGCILLFTNAVNYIDGLDGLLGLLSIVTFLYFIILIQPYYYPTIIPLIIFLLIYLLFNFGILPKQFIGDAGSLGFGFGIASYSIIFTQVYKIIHPSIIIWALAFYVYEFFSINTIRLMKKKNIFKRDLNFVFNHLANKYNKTISLFLCIILHSLFCLNGLILNKLQNYILSLFLFFLFFLIYLIIRIRLEPK